MKTLLFHLQLARDFSLPASNTLAQKFNDYLMINLLSGKAVDELNF